MCARMTDSEKADFKAIFFAIASPQALGILQDIVKVCRRPDFPGPGAKVSSAERVEAIQHLDQTIAYNGLLKRCHVLHLFRAHSYPDRQTNDEFIYVAADSISNPTAPRLGNPLHHTGVNLARAMMKGIYPRLQPKTTAYEKQHRIVKRLGKLGHRLEILVSAFGLGILGLLPLGNTSTTEGYLNITDEM